MAAVQVSAYRETPFFFFKRENKIRELGKSGSSAGFVRVSGGKKNAVQMETYTRHVGGIEVRGIYECTLSLSYG